MTSGLVIIVLLNNRLKIQLGRQRPAVNSCFWNLVGMEEDAKFVVEKRANKDVMYYTLPAPWHTL